MSSCLMSISGEKVARIPGEKRKKEKQQNVRINTRLCKEKRRERPWNEGMSEAKQRSQNRAT